MKKLKSQDPPEHEDDGLDYEDQYSELSEIIEEEEDWSDFIALHKEFDL
tara:strand:+ start:26569 stop:26715 length:147 start_codon:yes stop_codon:yes gene_type:complete